MPKSGVPLIWRVHVGNEVFKVWENFPNYPSDQFHDMTVAQQELATALMESAEESAGISDN